MKVLIPQIAILAGMDAFLFTTRHNMSVSGMAGYAFGQLAAVIILYAGMKLTNKLFGSFFKQFPK